MVGDKRFAIEVLGDHIKNTEKNVLMNLSKEI